MTTVLPGAIRQFAYVVPPERLQSEIEHWLARGAGPWCFMHEIEQLGYVHRGDQVRPVLSLGFANSGDTQIELITAHDDTPSPFREFLDAGQSGFHHCAWWTDDWTSWLATAAAAGHVALAHGDGGGAANWAYYDIGGPGLVEVMELTASTRWLVDTVATAHRDWDGTTDPVRSLF